MSKINLIFFNISPDIPVIKELANYYRKNDGYNVEFIKNQAEVIQYLASEGNGILVLDIKSKNDLQTSIDILKNQRALIKSGLLKPTCFLHVKNIKVEKLLAKYGCGDILEQEIKAKTFSFKIDFWSRGLNTLIKKKDNELKLKSSAADDPKKADAKKSDFIVVPALKLQSDIWIIKAKSDYKKVLRRWLIRMLGPSPAIGQWVELEPQPGDKESTWKYVLKKDRDNGQFILEDGAWVFSGTKPEFDWKTNRWNFSSDAPHLYFYADGGTVYSRFKFENGSIHITENSQYALTKENLILESCDAKLNFEADAHIQEANKKLEGETEKLGGQLQGEGSTEEDLGGRLQGKLSREKSLEEEEDNHKNQFTEEAIDTHWGGKSSTDSIDHGPMSGDIKPIAKEKEANKDRSFKEEDIDTHWGGKSSTDSIDAGPLSGKIKPLARGKEANKDHNFKEDDIDTHWGGEASTNNIDAGPLSGKIKPLAREKEANKDQSFDEEAIDSHWGGEASTDSIDSSPLGGKIAPEQKEAIEKELEKAGLKAIDKNGNSIPLAEVAQMTEEELSRAGIQVLNKENKPINPAEVTDAIDEQLARAGIKPLAREKTPSVQENVTHTSRTSLNGSIKEATSGKTKANLKNSLKIAPTAKEQKMDELEELLGSGLVEHTEDIKRELEAKGLATIVGKEITKTKDLIDLSQVIGAPAEINLESGDLKVIVKQKTHVGNDVTFLCQFQDFYPDELIIQAPKNALLMDVKIIAKVTLSYSGKKIIVYAQGQIESQEEFNEKFDTYNIAIDDIDESLYEDFLSLYQERQESINDFMQKAKGF